MPKTTQTETLLDLLKRLDQQAGDDAIVTVADLRAAADLFELFPEHRFRQAFHQALTALVESDRVAREGDDLFID